MAQIIDLGKIRFNWAGTYSGSTVYSYNDLVKYGNNIYAYINTAAGSGQAPANGAGATNTSYWVLATEGITYRGLYAEDVIYYKNDIVIDNQNTYIVITGHTATNDIALGNMYLELIALGQEGLPSQAGNENEVLTTDGSNVAWADTVSLTRGYWGTSKGTTASSFETTAALTDTASVFAKSSSDFAQLVMVNPNNAPNASADVIVYTADGNNDSGWIDLGITSSVFDAETFGITGPHDGYIFMSAPRGTEFEISKAKVIATTATLTTTVAHGYSVGNIVKIEGVDENGGTGLVNQLATITAVTSTTFSFTTAVTPFSEVNLSPAFGATYKPKGNGNIVLATDKTGLENAIVFAAGGFDSGTSQMAIYPENKVDISIATSATNSSTGALVVAGGVGIGEHLFVEGTLNNNDQAFIGDGAKAFETSATLTDAALVINTTGGENDFAQVAFRNTEPTSSTDFLAYMDNGTDTDGWIDMGIAGSDFNQETYGITGPGDGYIFLDTIPDSGLAGNLVFATGDKGTDNKIVFAAGGFASGNTQMSITPDVNVHIEIPTPSTSATTGALTVVGGVGITGDVNIAGNITFGGSGTQISTANLAVTAPFVFMGDNSTVSTNDLGIITEGKYTITNIPVQTVINKALTSNVVTLTTRNAHNFAAGDSVVVAAIDATFNGTFTIVDVPSTTTFTYAKTAGNVASVGIGQVNYTITNKALTSNVATLTTSITHAMTVGTIVDVTSVDSTFNGTYTITAVTTNTFSYAKTASNVTSVSASGTATYYTSVSTATVSAANRTRYSSWSKDATDNVWKLVSNISTSPTTTIDYSQDTYGAGVDIVYDTIKVGGITVQGSGALYGYPYGTVTLTGNISSPAWTTTGIGYTTASRTLTDTSSSGTVANAYTNELNGNTIAASSATTYTNYANLHVGTPTAGSNVTITNPYSIIADGTIKTSSKLEVANTSTLTGAVTLASTLTGGSSSDITINTNKFTVNAGTGNTAVGGTLGVTGNTTLSGTLGVTSAATLSSTLGVTGTSTFTGQATFNGGINVTGTLEAQEIREVVSNVTLTSNSGTLVWSAANVYYIGTAPTANMTLNVTGVPTDNNYMYTVNVAVVQGSTGYYPSTFQIDGASQTIKWAGGNAPTPTSSAGKIDFFNFTMHRLSGGTWNVYGAASLNF